ncbi:flavin reductase family protein, partial [Delftia acidovorans]
MYFEMQSLNSEQRSNILHSLVLPRPIAWISSVDGDGTVNVAPFSFFNAMSGDPPLLCVCIGSRQGVLKDTARNIAATGEFVVNLVSEPLARRMAVTAIEFGAQVDESAQAGLVLGDARRVKAPRIVDSPASFECRVRQLIDIDGVRSLVLADVLAAHVMDAAVVDGELMYFDPAPMELIARLQNPGWYGRV